MDPIYPFSYALLKGKLRGARRLAVLGAGSTLRADDAAGIRAVEQLQDSFAPDKYPELLCCAGETAPENFSGAIKNFQPEHILVFDAADIGKMPGEAVEIDPACIGGPSFCSHMLPLKLMLDYLAGETGAKITLIGIQYQSLEFDRDMTQSVKESVDSLADALEKFIREEITGA